MYELLSNGGQLTSNGHTIATRGGPGPNPGSLDNPVGDTVYRPTWKNGIGHLMEAVAAQAGALWGLFYDVKDAHYYWQHVAVLPLRTGESATAAASAPATASPSAPGTTASKNGSPTSACSRSRSPWKKAAIQGGILAHCAKTFLQVLVSAHHPEGR